MKDNLGKNREDGRVDGKNHPRWRDKKQSGVRRVVSSAPGEESLGRLRHVMLGEDGKNANELMDDEAYLNYIRERVGMAAVAQLLHTKVLLNKLERRKAVLEGVIEGFGLDEKDTIPAKSADEEVGPDVLTVERASEYLLSRLGKGSRNIICCDIRRLTIAGAENIAGWYGTLRFPDMDAADFSDELRQIFLKGNVEAVFAGDAPVITRGEKLEYGR